MKEIDHLANLRMAEGSITSELDRQERALKKAQDRASEDIQRRVALIKHLKEGLEATRNAITVVSKKAVSLDEGIPQDGITPFLVEVLTPGRALCLRELRTVAHRSGHDPTMVNKAVRNRDLFERISGLSEKRYPGRYRYKLKGTPTTPEQEGEIDAELEPVDNPVR